MKLDIVQIVVKDWKEAVSWYKDNLGLRVLFREDHHRYCQLAFSEGDTLLALAGTDELVEGPGRCHPNIHVEDLEATVADLKGRGVKFLGEIRGGDEGFRIVSIEDLEGNRLDFYEYT